MVATAQWGHLIFPNGAEWDKGGMDTTKAQNMGPEGGGCQDRQRQVP